MQLTEPQIDRILYMSSVNPMIYKDWSLEQKIARIKGDKASLRRMQEALELLPIYLAKSDVVLRALFTPPAQDEDVIYLDYGMVIRPGTVNLWDGYRMDIGWLVAQRAHVLYGTPLLDMERTYWYTNAMVMDAVYDKVVSDGTGGV